jgi:SagB-type dehydrogenase family enzyme
MENNIGKEFIRLTKYENLEPSLQSLGETIPPLEMPLAEGAQVLPLPEGKSIELQALGLAELVEKRQTLRKYAQTALTMQELTFLLWGTQGIKRITDKPVTFRTVPSAGARHAFETYLMVNRVEGLEPGLYRYLAVSHQLAHLDAPEDFRKKLTEACLKQQHVHNSAVTFIWVADVKRTIWRYCQRGYRYLYLDAGHVCQNLYLLGEALGCGICAIGAYNDDKVNDLMGLDGEEQFVIYMGTVGKRN